MHGLVDTSSSLPPPTKTQHTSRLKAVDTSGRIMNYGLTFMAIRFCFSCNQYFLRYDFARPPLPPRSIAPPSYKLLKFYCQYFVSKLHIKSPLLNSFLHYNQYGSTRPRLDSIYSILLQQNNTTANLYVCYEYFLTSTLTNIIIINNNNFIFPCRTFYLFCLLISTAVKRSELYLKSILR